MLQESVLVERTGSSIFASVVYENLPQFCSHCKSIGHEISHSRFNKFKKAEETSELRKNNTQRVTQARSGDNCRKGAEKKRKQQAETRSGEAETVIDTSNSFQQQAEKEKLPMIQNGEKQEEQLQKEELQEKQQ